MTTKHTAGPWGWERENSLKIRILDKRGFEIANSIEYSCGYTPRPDWYDEYNNTQMEANARLIASAPELLEALEKALPLLRLLTVRQVIDGGMEAINAAGLNERCINEGLAEGRESLDLWKFVSAIAKAKGE